MILFGASGHARVIIDILKQSGKEVSYLIDANPDIKQLLGYEVRGEGGDLPDEDVLISIGANHIRKKIVSRLESRFTTAIHPTAVIDGNVSIGEGTVVMAGAVINSSTSIGKHVIINTRSSIDHDTRIEDFVHVSPGATVCGGVSIGEGAHLGAGAVVIPGVQIGKWVTIGAGAIIIDHVPDKAVVVGNPGRIIKYND